MTPLISSALLRAQTDERLAALAASGHDRAFEAIVERYRRPLLRYLRRLLSDTLAEDVVQATFINAWSSLRTGTEVRDLRPWLYRIAHNAAINALKKVGEAMEEVPESIGGFATEPAAELERRDEMQRALMSIAALPSRQRAALLAVAVDGRAHSDVAAELGLTDGAVRQLVHRARTTLRTGVTALTPLPLLHALMVSAGDSTVARVAEVAAGAGGAGAASLSLKAGAAAVLATGAIVTGGPQIAHVVRPSERATTSTASSAPAKATPIATTSPGAAPLAMPNPAADKVTTTSSSSGRSHRQRRRGRNSESGSSATKGRHDDTTESSRSGSNSGRDETTSGHRRGSTSSGRRGGDRTETHRRGRGDNETATADHRGRGTGEAGGGATGGVDEADDLVVTPPTTTAAEEPETGGGGHANAPAPPPATTPTTTPTVPGTTTPTTPTDPSGMRVESGGSGGSS